MTSHEPVVKAIAGVLKEHLTAIADKFKRIDARLDAMPVNLADVYRGVWSSGESYERGELLTEGGGLWLCLHGTGDKPGKSPDWRLIVKRGDVR